MSAELVDEFVDDVNEGEGAEIAEAAVPEAKPAQDDLRAAMTELAGTVKTLATPKTNAPAPTQDEIDEYWAVYNPEKENPEFFRKWMRLQSDMDPEQLNSSIKERKELFGQMQKGLVKQAVIGSQRLFQQELAKLREEFAPVTAHVSEQKAEKTRAAFYDQYPSLSEKTSDGKPRYGRIIQAVTQDLSTKTFDSQESFFKALAEGAAREIQNVIPEFSLESVQSNKKQTAVTSPRLPRTSVGGTGGVAGGGGTPKKSASDDDSGSIDWT